MVTFDERLGYLLLGCAIGYVLRILQVWFVSKMKTGRHRDERGFMRRPLIADVAIVLVVLLTAFAAFKSQKASNDVTSTQDKVERVSTCNQLFLTDTIEALNERTQFTRELTAANSDLQKAQADFLNVAGKNPPPSDAEAEDAFDTYLEALNQFNRLSDKTVDKVGAFPFPSTEALVSCLSDAKE
jgi:hypothetical protein